MSIEVQPIAHVRSPWDDKFGIPRQPGLIREAWGEVEFVGEYGAVEAREGLEGFSHLWVTFLFDQVEETQTRLRVRPPRLGGNEKVGVFASRSPFRPNRIGLSVCEIESVFPVLRLRGVDLLDGTPILDLRPYVPYVDSIPEAQAGFAPSEPRRVPVEVSSELATQWQALESTACSVIEGMISLQPGPAYRKGEKRTYRARVAGWEVEWMMSSRGGVVTGLLPVAQASTGE